MRLDLHIHSTASDGTEAPEAVIAAAAAGKLDVVALTDHDTTAGVEAAHAAGVARAVEVVPGIEMSSTSGGREIHVLGYFVDPSAPAIRAHEARALGLRAERMRRMIRRLSEQGVQVTMDDVERAAGEDRQALARPHLARALLEAGEVVSVADAFDRFIGDDHAAYVPTDLVSPEGAIEIIIAAGGIPIWAHPPHDLLDALLPALTRAGLRGLEVYRPRTPADRVLRLERMARSSGLLLSGGSDWHGPDGGELGSFYVSGEEVARLLEAGGI